MLEEKLYTQAQKQLRVSHKYATKPFINNFSEKWQIATEVDVVYRFADTSIKTVASYGTYEKKQQQHIYFQEQPEYCTEYNKEFCTTQNFL
jgi:hypothetical protein